MTWLKKDKEAVKVYPNDIIFGMGLYEICVMAAMLVGLFLADRMATKSGFSVALQRHLIFAIVTAVIVGFFGAILFQAVYDWIATGEFSLRSGMTFYGGLIFGAAAFLAFWFLVGRCFKLQEETVKKFPDLANIAGCVLPLVHGIGRLGCFFAGCCHGAETTAWYGVEMDGVKVVPLQLFEALFLFAISGALFALYLYRKKRDRQGLHTFPIYLITYGVWRFFIEYARADDRGQTIVPFLTPSQLVALLMIGIGIAYCAVWFIQKKSGKPQEKICKNNVEEKENGKSGSDAKV